MRQAKATIVLVFMMLIAALSMGATTAEAHTIKSTVCYQAAKQAGPYKSYPWQVRFNRCMAWAKKHNKSHVKPAGCAGLGVEATIRCVFGAAGDKAVAVAICESGLNTNASNGQYLGIFQMGENERATYGHGSTALAQAQAAYRYYLAAGGWGPWTCG